MVYKQSIPFFRHSRQGVWPEHLNFLFLQLSQALDTFCLWSSGILLILFLGVFLDSECIVEDMSNDFFIRYWFENFRDPPPKIKKSYIE